MRAIVIKQYGGPEVLAIEERPAPTPGPGQVVIEVKAFGLNHAEIYFRKGVWGDVAEISGIECVGLVKADPDRRFAPGQKVVALVGGMGRSINGSYAEFVRVPSTNVAAVETDARVAADTARRIGMHLSFWLVASMFLGAFAAGLAATEGGAARDGR